MDVSYTACTLILQGDDDMNDNDEFEMDDDYGVDHYASGDDGGYDSGGDGEAFF